MSVINMVNSIKDLFPDYVVFIKIGTFHECNNNYVYIISYLFKYKLKTLISKDITCDFPVVLINKIKYVLENHNINYLMVDKKHNYEEIKKMNFKRFCKYTCKIF